MNCINISKQYNARNKNEFALQKLDLDIYYNDFTVIMGSSGSGKSTLLQCLSGMDTPTTGDVYFNSMCVTKMNDSLLSNFRKKHIGFIFQNMNLVDHLSVLENVTLTGFLLNQKRNAEITNDGKELLKQVDLQNI